MIFDVRTIRADAMGTPRFEDVPPEGDSRICGANGEPLIVYHGTNVSFTAFEHRQSERMYGPFPVPVAPQAFFFTPTYSCALEYALARATDCGGIALVVSAYLTSSKPVDLRSPAPVLDELAAQLTHWSATRWQLHGIEKESLRVLNAAALPMLMDDYEAVRALKSMGYDGAIFTELQPPFTNSTSYAVFEPTQIRLINAALPPTANTPLLQPSES